MAQSETNLFSLIVSISFLSIGLAFVTLFLALLFVPAWQVFLMLRNPWYCSLFVLFAAPLIGLIKIPVSLKIGEHPASGNLLSLCLPPAILVYIYPTLQINWSAEMALPPFLSLVFFYVSSFHTERGSALYRITLTLSSLTTVFIFHSIVGDAVRELMWLSFASQFCTIVLVEFLRSRQSGGLSDCEAIVLGGHGIRDPLWVAPSTALVFSYIGYSTFWNMNPLSLLS
ncbi:MAG: hypothetical protein VX278_03445 [Myxococcota bacterium]|nr:hypothetical protein [Myxococcota bacterium]